MTTALCVVDMQYAFMDTGEFCVSGVLKEVALAKRRNAPIVILEYKSCGSTIAPIRSLLKGYEKKTYVIKNTDGGGRQVVSSLKKNGWTPKKIRFVGVNRSYCVYSTVRGVKARLKGKVKIEVALNSTWCDEPKHGERMLSGLGVKFVETYGIQVPEAVDMPSYLGI